MFTPVGLLVKENIPIIDENNNVIKNNITIKLYNKMCHSSKFKRLSEDLNVPVLINK